MLSQVSSQTGKRYPIRAILNVAELSASAWYDKRKRKDSLNKLKTGPKTICSDQEVLKKIKEYLSNPVFVSEGYIKIHKRIRHTGFKVGKNRIYRIMKEAGLLQNQQSQNGSSRIHDGKIITQKPNQMWATDGKEFKTDKEGKCWFIGIMDHFNDEIISFVVRKRFDRYAALEPLREAVKSEFKTINKDVCKNLGIALRSDHGSQFESAAYQNELKYLGIDYSPAFVRSPECNGIIERFHRTLNEQIFKLNKFASIEEAQIKIQDFVKKYNEKWILHRLGLQSPKDYRTNYMIQNVKEL